MHEDDHHEHGEDAGGQGTDRAQHIAGRATVGAAGIGPQHQSTDEPRQGQHGQHRGPLAEIGLGNGVERLAREHDRRADDRSAHTPQCRRQQRCPELQATAAGGPPGQGQGAEQAGGNDRQMTGAGVGQQAGQSAGHQHPGATPEVLELGPGRRAACGRRAHSPFRLPGPGLGDCLAGDCIASKDSACEDIAIETAGLRRRRAGFRLTVMAARFFSS